MKEVANQTSTLSDFWTAGPSFADSLLLKISQRKMQYEDIQTGFFGKPSLHWAVSSKSYPLAKMRWKGLDYWGLPFSYGCGKGRLQPVLNEALKAIDQKCINNRQGSCLLIRERESCSKVTGPARLKERAFKVWSGWKPYPPEPAKSASLGLPAVKKWDCPRSFPRSSLTVMLQVWLIVLLWEKET